MGKGRKPTPTELKDLIGNPGKRPMNVNEPQFTAEAPYCPDWMGEEAQVMWNRVAPELLGCKLLTRADEGVLVGYCVSYGQLVGAQKLLELDGLTLKTQDGSQRVHPAVGIKNLALSQLRAFGSELGLSPVARTRLQSPTHHEDEFDKWKSSTA